MSVTTPVLAKAGFAFSGKNNDELSFSKNDIITITQQLEGGWWEGTLNNTTGWFPSNYVEILTEKDKLVRSKSVPNASPMANVSSCASPVFRSEEPISNAQFRAEVLKELETSESNYIKSVEDTYEGIILPIEKSGILSLEDFSTLACNIDQILELQKDMFSQILENISYQLPQQRIGGVFLNSAANLKKLMLEYCWNHPRAVEILTEKNTELRTELAKMGKEMKNLIMGLSEPFRHLERYPVVLQELERSLSESHVDRGDIQRSCSVFKEIRALCEAARKQKETQLEFLYTRQVEKWASFEERGKILYVGSGTIQENENKKDRCIALFAHLIMILEITPDPNVFNLIRKYATSGLVARKVEGGIGFTGKENFTLLLSQNFDIERWMDALSKVNGLKIEENVISSRPQTPQRSLNPLTSLSPSRSPEIAKLTSSTSRMSIEKKQSFGKSDIRFNHELGMIVPEGFEDVKKKDDSNMPTGSRLRLLPFSIHRYKNEQKMRKGVKLRKQDHQNDAEDAFILQLIDGYAKLPSILGSGVEAKPQLIVAEQEKILVEEVVGDQIVLQEKSLVDTVYSLKDQVSALRQEVAGLHTDLEKEQKARRRLEDIILKQSADRLHLQSCAMNIGQDFNTLVNN